MGENSYFRCMLQQSVLILLLVILALINKAKWYLGLNKHKLDLAL